MASTLEEKVAAYCKSKGWQRTGVFATDEDISKARTWSEECAATPFVRVHGKWLPDEAEALFKRRIDELAMAHGLPDRGEDHYGLVATGEFVVTSAAIEVTRACQGCVQADLGDWAGPGEMPEHFRIHTCGRPPNPT